MFTLRTFGAAPGLIKAGGYVQLGQREFMLLVVLLVEGKKSHPRDELAQLIWHGAASKAARHSLAQALYTLRKTIPELRPRVSNTEVTFDKGVIVADASLFDKAVAENDYSAACSVYVGPFLNSISGSLNTALQDWCDRQRDRFTAAWQLLLEKTAEREAASGNWGRVVAVTEKLLELFPSSVDWHKARIEALHMRGEMAQANEAVAALRLQCAGEPGVDQAIADLKRKLSQSSTGKRHFVGRESELQLLNESWRRSRASGAQTTIVVGESGIGKTALVTQFLRYAAIKGARTAILNCDRRAQHVPYSTVLHLIRSLNRGNKASATEQVTREIATGRRPETNASDTSAFRDRIADTLYELLVKSPTEGRCIFLDDADDADRSSLEILAELQRSQPPYAVQLILASRGGSSQPLREFLDLFTPAVSVVEVGELPEGDAAELLNLLSTSKAAKTHHTSILDAARGHPFYLTSLAASLRDNPARFPSRVPIELTEHIKHRFTGLTTAAKSVLFAAAMCPEHSGLEIIVAATRISEEHALAAVEELIAQRLLLARGNHVALAHSLLKDVAQQVASPIRTALYHNRIADHLVASRSGPGLIAFHYEKAGKGELAGRYLLVALRHACRLFALPEAEGLFSRLVAAGPSRRQDARAKRLLGKLYFELRRFEEAARTFASIPGFRPAHLTLDLRIAEVAASLETSDIESVTQQLQTIAAEALSAKEHSAVVNALVNLANVLTLSGRPEFLRAVAQQLQRCLEQENLASVQRITAQTVAGQLLAITGDLDKGKELVSLTLIDPTVELDWRVCVRANGAMGVICLLSSQYEDAVAYLGRSIEQCSIAGADRWRMDQLSNYGLAQWCAGNIEEADSAFRELADVGARRSGLRNCTALVNLAQMWYDVGNLDRARWFASRTLAEGGDGIGRVAMAAWAILGLVALYEQNATAADLAYDNMTRLWAEMGPPPLLSYITLFDIRYLRLQNRREEAHAHLEAVLALPTGDEVIRTLLQVERELMYA